jgi:hypothetical protein
MTYVAAAKLRLVVNLLPPAEIERMPEPRAVDFLGCKVPAVALAPFEASAPAKLRLALRGLTQDARAPIKAAVPS